MKIKTTGSLRKELADCLIKARDGQLDADAVRGVVAAANAINQSIAIETKARRQLLDEQRIMPDFGALPIGDTADE